MHSSSSTMSNRIAAEYNEHDLVITVMEGEWQQSTPTPNE